MTDTAGTTGPRTPPRGGNVASAPEHESTPLAKGTASVSENIGTVGMRIKDLRPWITRDVENYRTCEIDTMLKELLYHCRDTQKPNPDKSELLMSSLHAVLKVCNEGTSAQGIKTLLTEFLDVTDERKSYKPFVRAVNTALLELRKVNAPGIVCPNDEWDPSNALFHHNDQPLCQLHQGEKSTRKPDVVVVPLQAARLVQQDGDLSKPADIFGEAYKAPEDKNFQWKDVLSTVELKRSGRRINLPPAKYKVTDYTAPKIEQKYMDLRKDIKASAQPPGSVPAPIATSAPKASSEPRRSQRLKADNKRPHDGQPSNEARSKRTKSNNEPPMEEEPEKLHPNVQNGLYVAEMFAAHIARQSVISCVIMNDIFYVWYFDRQDAIQCAGFNFIQDLPRFMVLLLIMQRMQNVQWGLNPLFARATGSAPQIHVEDKDLGSVDLKFIVDTEDRTTHYGLRGRATDVFPVESKLLSQLMQQHPSENSSNEMVAKLYWPEEARESEPDILRKVQEIAEDYPDDVKGHIPEMVWFHKFDETSTANIRKTLGIDDPERGSRVLYIIVFRKLIPITSLSGDDFLRAWWQVVVCHRILWSRLLRHRDISPSNLMVYKSRSNKWVGVLNDYDLSSTQDGPRGNERTGTIPFMAIELLEEDAIEGKVEHLYQHDVESLIWVLAWVCLRYEDGKLRSNRPFNQWLKQDANGCREKKTDFMFVGRHKAQPSPSHKSNWETARGCFRPVGNYYNEDPKPTMTDAEVYQTWLMAWVPSRIRD